MKRYWRSIAGAILWLGVVAWWHPLPVETSWAVALLLLSPLVLVPLGLELAIRAEPFRRGEWLLLQASRWQLPAAVGLTAAFLLPEGTAAVVLCLPWLILTALMAVAGLLRIWQRGWRPIEQLCMDAGLVYIVIGAGWAVLSRAGVRPLDFEPVIVLLTAIHFHHAGFVLPLLTGLAAQAQPGWLARFAALGVIGGVPLVAIGITTTQLGAAPILESCAVSLTVLAAWAAALLHGRLAWQQRGPTLGRALRGIAAVALASAMGLAFLYGWRFFLRVDLLDIPWMRALHGTANALGFALPASLAWVLDFQQESTSPTSQEN